MPGPMPRRTTWRGTTGNAERAASCSGLASVQGSGIEEALIACDVIEGQVCDLLVDTTDLWSTTAQGAYLSDVLTNVEDDHEHLKGDARDGEVDDVDDRHEHDRRYDVDRRMPSQQACEHQERAEGIDDRDQDVQGPDHATSNKVRKTEVEERP
jgi:hypothetical protein